MMLLLLMMMIDEMMMIDGWDVLRSDCCESLGLECARDGDQSAGHRSNHGQTVQPVRPDYHPPQRAKSGTPPVGDYCIVWVVPGAP